MKNIRYKAGAALLSALLLAGCYNEKSPEAVWKYTGPTPEITDGPSAAQKMCYEIFKQYDVHVYYNLSGDMAGKTEVGYTQENSIISANAAAIPFQAADDASGERFLTLLQGFFSLLPDELVSSGIHRRHVLVKINPGPTRIADEEGTPYFSCTHTEDQQGIIHYGYLMNDEDTNNTLVSNVDGWKWNICYEFLRGREYTYFKKDAALPAEFEQVSEGLYYNDNETEDNVFYDPYTRVYDRSVAKECGFVHPFGGVNSYEGAPYADWGSYAAWILTVPADERSADLLAYPRIKTKYDMVIDYYKQQYNIDLEELGTKYRALTVD